MKITIIVEETTKHGKTFRHEEQLDVEKLMSSPDYAETAAQDAMERCIASVSDQVWMEATKP